MRGSVANNARAGANPTIGGIMDTQRPARTRFTRAAWPAFALLLAAALWPATSQAITWIEQVEATLTCTSFAQPAERATLKAPFIPDVRNPRAVQAYFQGKPQNLRHARFRQLTMVAAAGWWADMVNDQRLRGDAYAAVWQLAAGYAGENPNDVLFRQISRCAQSQVLGAMLEIGEIEGAKRMAAVLIQDYGRSTALLPVEDWPVLLALRESSLEPRAGEATAALGILARQIASAEGVATAPWRASRLLAAAARGSLATGKVDDARNLALQSMVITGTPSAPKRPGAPSRCCTTCSCRPMAPRRRRGSVHCWARRSGSRPACCDRAAAFEALERASLAVDAAGDYELAGGLAARRQQPADRLAQPAAVVAGVLPLRLGAPGRAPQRGPGDRGPPGRRLGCAHRVDLPRHVRHAARSRRRTSSSPIPPSSCSTSTRSTTRCMR